MVNWGTACFTGPMLTACMVDKSSTSLDYIDEGWNVLTYDKEDYYENSIKLLFMLLLTGNWWKPELSTTSKVNSFSDNKKPKFSINSNFISNSLNVNYTINKMCTVEFNLYSVNGKKVYHTIKNPNNIGSNTINIKFNHKRFSTGVYYGELITHGQKSIAKINFLK